MPSNTQRVSALAITLALGLGGGYLASTAVADLPALETQHQQRTEAPHLQVNVFGVRNDRGHVHILVFDQAEAFEQMDYQRAVAYQTVPARVEPTRIDFPELRDAGYAVMLMHDENDDNTLNMDGETPLEGYMVSGSNEPNDNPVFDWSWVSNGKVNLVMQYW